MKKPTPPPNIHSCIQPTKCCWHCCELHHAIYYPHQSAPNLLRNARRTGGCRDYRTAGGCFLAELNVKKTNAVCRALYHHPWKRDGLMPFETTARANICGDKVRCAVSRRLFQNTGWRALGVYTVRVSGCDAFDIFISPSFAIQ